MKQKEIVWKGMLGIIFAFAMVLGLMPGTSKTAYADSTHTHDGVTFVEWTSDTMLPDQPGSYYLTKDITLNSAWQVPVGTTNLCLNGHKIIRDSEKETISVVSESTLILYDEHKGEEAGCITHTQGKKGVGVTVTGKLTLCGGKISNNEDSGVHITSDGIFNMSGGEISGNKGRGVYDEGVFNMTGGSITGNIGEAGAGLFVIEGRTFTMSGGSITHNVAKNGTIGGGVCLAFDDNSRIEISEDAEIADNTLEDGTPSNVRLNRYLFDGRNIDEKISIINTLSSTVSIGISILDDNNIQIPGIFTIGWKDKMGTDADPADFFFSDNPKYGVKLTEDGQEGQLVLAHSVTVVAADNMTKTTDSGENTQTGLVKPMKEVV